MHLVFYILISSLSVSLHVSVTFPFLNHCILLFSSSMLNDLKISLKKDFGWMYSDKFFSFIEMLILLRFFWGNYFMTRSLSYCNIFSDFSLLMWNCFILLSVTNFQIYWILLCKLVRSIFNNLITGTKFFECRRVLLFLK